LKLVLFEISSKWHGNMQVNTKHNQDRQIHFVATPFLKDILYQRIYWRTHYYFLPVPNWVVLSVPVCFTFLVSLK